MDSVTGCFFDARPIRIDVPMYVFAIALSLRCKAPRVCRKCVHERKREWGNEDLDKSRMFVSWKEFG